MPKIKDSLYIPDANSVPLVQTGSAPQVHVPEFASGFEEAGREIFRQQAHQQAIKDALAQKEKELFMRS